MSVRPRVVRWRNRLSLHSAASELLLLLKLIVLQLELIFLLQDCVKTCTQTLVFCLSILDLCSQIAHNLAERHLGQLLLFTLTEMHACSISIVEILYARTHSRDHLTYLVLSLHHGFLLSFT